MYAQLVQQRFQPPTKLFGRPPAPSSPNFQAYDLGAKLAVGFEMLAARGGGNSRARSGEEPGAATATALSTSPSGVEWERFVANLEAKGYFNGNIEGSRDYKVLRRQAETYFAKDVAGKSTRRESARLQDPIDAAGHRLCNFLGCTNGGRDVVLDKQTNASGGGGGVGGLVGAPV